MKGKLPNQKQTNLFQPNLNQIVNPMHELVLLAEQIDWKHLEKEFAPLYSNTGSPAKPIRLMVSLLVLKHLYNHSDEGLIEFWVQNPYYQYFSGMDTFQWKKPCDPSDLVYFRNRIGTTGTEIIFKHSVEMHGADALEEHVLVDTTVQETNVTFPTDTKLHLKIIKGCQKIGEQEGLKLRQRYTRKIKELRQKLRRGNHARRRKEAAAARRHIKTIASRLVRDVWRKMNEDQKLKYHQKLLLFALQLEQQKQSSNKIYSFHEPHTQCIAKGKEHKPYEFGTKVSVAITAISGIVVSAFSLKENTYDGNTIEEVLDQTKRLHQHLPKVLVGDLGYRTKKTHQEIQIITPNQPTQHLKEHERRKRRLLMRRRTAIEPVIGHLKSDHRMQKSFYKGFEGGNMNALLACTAWNLKKLMKKLKEAFLLPVWSVLRTFTRDMEALLMGSRTKQQPKFTLNLCLNAA